MTNFQTFRVLTKTMTKREIVDYLKRVIAIQ